jgi:3-oxoacyl-[acyl-carrier protein] reductase
VPGRPSGSPRRAPRSRCSTSTRSRPRRPPPPSARARRSAWPATSPTARKAAQKVFVEQKYGKILNLSSISALGNRGQANYSAAKAGVQGFTRTLALELGPFGVNVNAIAPGFIATEMTDDTARRLKMDVEEFRRLNAEANPVKRVGFPEDIAAAAAFLCSDEASYITGQTLYVDGGGKI